MIDLNCDMGEGMAHDEFVMPYVTSANIACGFHAGNGDSIKKTIELSTKYAVKIGAHPSFRDRENFGRKEMTLSKDKLYALILEQLIRIDLIAKNCGATLHHVKAHGALYNMAARDAGIARILATAAYDFNENIILYGLSGSQMINEARIIGLKTAQEVFADRLYQDDGLLVPRSQEGSVITDPEQGLAQFKQIVENGTVTTINGNTIPVEADTVCIHGDGKNVLALARLLSSSNRALNMQA